MVYDLPLILLSVFVAMAAMITALDLGEAGQRRRWPGSRYLPSLLFGIGIWAMHFIGMFACRESLPVHYDAWLTLASFLAGLVASLLAFHPNPNAPLIRQPAFQAPLFATAVAAMHYLGMAALAVTPPIQYDPVWVAVSLTVALGGAFAALWVGKENPTLIWPRLPHRHRKRLCALLLGLTIAAMHYTAMAAVTLPVTLAPLTDTPWILHETEVGYLVTFSVVSIAIANLGCAYLDQDFHPLRFLSVIGVAEMSLMLLLPLMPRLSTLTQGVLDTGILLILTVPVAWRLYRQQAELVYEKLQAERHALEQETLNRLMSKRIGNRPLQEILSECLDEILHLPWMPLKPQGGIFLYRDERKRLELFVHHDMHPALLNLCREVSLGHCLCGQAALLRRIVHSACVDERHVTRYPGMTPHGHYNVPLLLGLDLVGVMVLYLNDGQPARQDEIRFLRSVGGTLALIIDRWRKTRTIHQMAFYDPLTQLPNRILLGDRFRTAAARCRRDQKRMALIFQDLDNFKHINDSLGHTIGDQLLQEATQRLRQVVRESDTLARLGGDEFILLLDDLDGDAETARREVETVCRKILHTLSKPFMIENKHLTVSCSMGVALYPEHGENLESLLQAADTAMYEAKRRGRQGFHFYDRNLHLQLTHIIDVKQELPHALEQGQLQLAYQPQFSLPDGRLIGAEVLLRWHHPVKGAIPPNEFIPIAESDGFIIRLGEWVLWQACRQKQRWHEMGLGRDCRLAVNLSLSQLTCETERGLFFQILEEVLDQTGLRPEDVELELTESLFAHQEHPVMTTNLDALACMGVSLAIDDFGTGHSSLGRLKFFPIDVIKIDRIFIRDLTEDQNDEAIVRAIVALGHTLNLKILAEGVETEAQLALLQEIGCDAIQGYLSGRPMPAEEFQHVLTTGRRPSHE